MSLCSLNFRVNMSMFGSLLAITKGPNNIITWKKTSAVIGKPIPELLEFSENFDCLKIQYFVNLKSFGGLRRIHAVRGWL